VCHAQRGAYQKGSFALRLYFVQPLSGKEERFLGGILGSVQSQAAPSQRAPNRGVVGVEDSFQPNAVHFGRSNSVGGHDHLQTVAASVTRDDLL